jgi:hypothetical protein
MLPEDLVNIYRRYKDDTNSSRNGFTAEQKLADGRVLTLQLHFLMVFQMEMLKQFQLSPSARD